MRVVEFCNELKSIRKGGYSLIIQKGENTWKIVFLKKDLS